MPSRDVGPAIRASEIYHGGAKKKTTRLGGAEGKRRFRREKSPVAKDAVAVVADRRSSDESEQDALTLQGLAVCERIRGGGGPDRSSEETREVFIPPPSNSRAQAREDPVVRVGENEEEEEEEWLDPGKNSFSHALRECQQNRKFRSRTNSLSASKHLRRRPASVDAIPTHVTTLSPPLLTIRPEAAMKRATATTPSQIKSGTFPSPGTPNYRLVGGHSHYHKGWNSERVPLSSNGSRRYGVNSTVLPPFSNGRGLPSKWEDAEKWIFSPVSGDGVTKSVSVAPQVHHRRPKSKSGPLGTPGAIGMSSSAEASPMVTCFDSGRVNYTVGSPFMAGVLVADRGCCSNSSGERQRRGGGGSHGVIGGECSGRRSYSANGDPYIMRSASVHGWSDMLIESPPSLPSLHGGRVEGTKELTTGMPPVVLKKDMATQMSPEGSDLSSPENRPPLSPCLSPTSAQLENHFAKLEVRDVQVDDQVTMTRLNKHCGHGYDKRSTNILRKKKSESAASCDVTETASMSRYKREEAKITAWENLQKAKADAAIKKLEMKLEKKRASSMEKILNKLRSSHQKAQQMRNSVKANQEKQDSISTKKTTSHISSLGGCFTCPAF